MDKIDITLQVGKANKSNYRKPKDIIVYDDKTLEDVFYSASHHWEKFGYKYLIVDVMTEYTKLYFQNQIKQAK